MFTQKQIQFSVRWQIHMHCSTETRSQTLEDTIWGTMALGRLKTRPQPEMVQTADTPRMGSPLNTYLPLPQNNMLNKT